jgi:hypothetical protein
VGCNDEDSSYLEPVEDSNNKIKDEIHFIIKNQSEHLKNPKQMKKP